MRKGGPKRQAYERPKVLKIRLVAGEMAQVTCKTRTSSTGPVTGCLRGACRAIGS